MNLTFVKFRLDDATAVDKMGLMPTLAVKLVLLRKTNEDIMFNIERGNIFSSMSVNKPKPR